MALPEIELQRLSEALTERILQRLSRFRKIGPADPLREHTLTKTKASLAEANRSGTLETLWKNENLLACIALWKTESGFLRVPASALLIEVDTQAREACHWFESKILALAPNLDHSVDLLLDSTLSLLIPALMNAGLFVDLLVTRGDCKVALSALLRHYHPPKELSHLALTITRASEAAEIHEAADILEREFELNPRYAWFKGNNQYIQFKRSELLKTLDDSSKHPFTIKRGNQVVGYFGAYIRNPDPLWRSCASTEFFFDRSIQGMGVIKTAYRILLELAVEEGVESFFGATSHAAMLRMNAVLKREPFGYLMRSGTDSGLWEELNRHSVDQ
jgi:hypothetical protein